MGFSRSLTVAAVLQIGPDDVFLREAENTQSSSSHGGVNRHARVGHQLGSLIKPGSAQKRPYLSRIHFENFGQWTLKKRLFGSPKLLLIQPLKLAVAS